MNKSVTKFSIIACFSSLISTLGGIIAGIATTKAVGAATTDIPTTPTVTTVEPTVVNNNVKQ